MSELTTVAQALGQEFKDQSWAIGILIIGFFFYVYEKSKSSGFFDDLSSFLRSKKHQRNKLNEMLNSDLYSAVEKINLKYQVKVIDYQILLRTRANHLPILIFINGFKLPRLALKRFKSSSRFLIFDYTTNRLVVMPPISKKEAYRRYYMGVIFFIIYIIIGLFYFYEIIYRPHLFLLFPEYTTFILISGYVIPILIIWSGYLVFRTFSDKIDALKLVEMERKDNQRIL